MFAFFDAPIQNSMPQPRLAPVRPRISAPCTGEPILLEDYVATRIDHGKPFTLNLCGELGIGKRTAIRHLAATTFKSQPLLLEGNERAGSGGDADRRFVVRVRPATKSGENVFLLPWGRDDLIEYLLSRDGVDVANIITRAEEMGVIRATRGKPGICRLAVDTLALIPEAETVSDCIRYGIRRLLNNDREYARAQRRALGLASNRPFTSPVTELLRLSQVQTALAAERVVRHIGRGQSGTLPTKLSFNLLPEVVSLAAREKRAKQNLRTLLTDQNAGFYASVLHAVDPSWQPDGQSVRVLQGATLPHACWPESDLSGIQAKNADFDSSDLCGTIIRNGCFDRARLTECNLALATMSETTFVQARLQGVNFRGAKLSYAIFRSADLARGNFKEASLDRTVFDHANLADCSFTAARLNANFRGARLRGTDFSKCRAHECWFHRAWLRSTNLDGSSWTDCVFHECNFEFMQISDANFGESRMEGSHFTGSKLRNVDFRGADLRQAGLADIDWQGVDLRGADLSGCAFHMGSSRSGLVDSPYPGHGSKTGFYTDDFDDSWHRPVEEIRKANLAGADLRGAKIDNTDFYLVDLRGALYDKQQYEHFVRCDAILSDRHT